MARTTRFLLLFSTLLFFFSPVKGMQLNLQDKLTNQSSSYRDDAGILFSANLAVDGLRTTWAHTLCDGYQWWRVDLGTAYRLTKIVIANRPNFRGRLEGAVLRAGMNPTVSDNTMISSSSISRDQARSSQDIEFPLDPSIIARYVGVELTAECLHFAEFMIEADPVISTGELVDFTCLNQNPVLSSQTGSTYIGGYKGAELQAANVAFGRRFYTGTGNGLPTSCSCIEAPTSHGTTVTRQYMYCPSGACACGGTGTSCLYRIGAFFCQIDTASTVEKITTITLNSNAEILPERQTITVNRDEAVSLRVTTTLDSPPAWRWRRTSDTFDGWLDEWFDHQVLNISQVSTSDAGVYECHAAGVRLNGVHAIFRLIVRACPSNLWDPTAGCVKQCPVCYNGGVCHDRTGQCICPPGFSGIYCHFANGRNVFGLHGTLRCRRAGGPHDISCRGYLFCLQDPFGCTCAAGYKGLGCDQDCDEPNTFGPYCSQTCHCAEGITCLTDTGHCHDASCTEDVCPHHCADGWKGLNCQVRTPCPDGYYGDLCNDRCHCLDDQACNEDMGECTNGCPEGYIGASCNEDGRPVVVYLGQTFKPNAGQSVTVRCTVVGNPLPEVAGIILEGADGQRYPPVGSDESPDLNAYRRTNEYIVTTASAASLLTCYPVGTGGIPPTRTLNLEVYEPPYLVSTPTEGYVGTTSITVEWNAWMSTQGGGDGPILRYEVHYRLTSQDYTPYTNVRAISNTSTSVGISNLELDTEYDFVVVVVREGEGGAGPPSSKLTIRTQCGIPTQAPTFTLEAESGTELRLMWEFPPSSTWQCKSLARVWVYRKLGTPNSFSYSSDYDASNTQAVLGSLSPCTRYDVKIRFRNRGGLYSPYSDSKGATTATTAPGPVTSYSVFELTPGNPYDQLGVLWSAPDENSCPVYGYLIIYTLTRLTACPAGYLTPVTRSKHFGSDVTTTSLNDLKAYSSYTVTVVATNSFGNSAERTKIRSRPAVASSFIPTVTVLDSDVTSSRIRFTWDAVPCEELNGQFYSYRTKLTTRNTVPVSSTTILETSLSPCTTYSFQVAVYNSGGLGTYSNATEVTTDADVPSRVTILSAEAVEGHPTILQVSWNPPSGSCPIDNYTVSYRLIYRFQCDSTVGTYNVSGTTTGTLYNITGLLPYSTYDVYVKATTSAGTGRNSYVERSQTASAVPIEPPMTVTVSERRQKRLTFQWQPPSCQGSLGLIIGYSYLLRDLERNAENKTGATDRLDIEISDLVPYTRYSFQVRARTEAGNGPYSDAVEDRTNQGKPLPVPDVTSPSADAMSITLRWNRPDPPHGIIVAYYIYYFIVSRELSTNQTVSVTENLNQTVLNQVLMGLESDSNYSVQVKAETVLKGPFSQPIYRITQEGIPGRPSSLRITDKEQTQMSITWGEPDEPNGRIISYKVTYRVKYKPYDRSFVALSTDDVSSPDLGPSTRSYVISSLVPGTKYEVSVSASTGKGEGSAAMIEGYTDLPTDMPAPDKPTFNPDMSSKTSVAISLPAVDSMFVVSYLVTVKKLATRRRRQSSLTVDVNGENFDTYDHNPDSYVAAEINKSDRTDIFVIGDNKTYGNYTNPPLQEGAMYEIRTGSASKTDNELSISWSDPLSVEAGQTRTPDQPDGDGNNGGGDGDITGPIIAVVLLVSTAAVIGTGFVMKRRRAQESAKPFESVGMAPVDNSRNVQKPPAPSPKLNHAASDDTLTNLVDATPKVASAKKTAGSAVTLPTDVHKRPTTRVATKPPLSSGPVKVDKLTEYVKGKKAKSNEGFKQDYGGLPNDQSHSSNVASKDENKVKNRYANIIAYDHSRVILDMLDNSPHSDYINASYIDGYKHPKKYIASQGPNIASTKDMWRMIWQERTSIIVMVTHLVEGGKKKCEQYWPASSKQYGEIGVSLDTESTSSNYDIRTFKLTKWGETRNLTQYHFTSWPDMGLPQFTSPLLNFVNMVKEGYANSSDMGPIVVHCSAGVGRTGTFITIDSMLDQAKAEGQVDVLQFVTKMRDKRVRMVQTQEQYIFIFDALLEWFLIGQTWIPIEDLRMTFDKLKTPSASGSSTILQEEFDKLRKLQAPAKADRFRGGKDPANVKKNRFPDNVPLDRGRPYLMTMGTERSTNYINASFVNGYWKRDQYIITQLPLPDTTIDFWSMVYDYKSSTIVMLNPLDPKDETICKYWPDKTLFAYGPYTVQLISMEAYDGIVCRTFTINNLNKPKDEAHTVRQFEFQGWPTDADIPSSTMALLKLVHYLEMWLEGATAGPITIQCIDGVRCSGVLCAILTTLDRMKTEKTVDVFQSVKSVCNSRPSAFAKLTQYKLCYEAALMHVESFDIYANLR